MPVEEEEERDRRRRDLQPRATPVPRPAYYHDDIFRRAAPPAAQSNATNHSVTHLSNTSTTTIGGTTTIVTMTVPPEMPSSPTATSYPLPGGPGGGETNAQPGPEQTRSAGQLAGLMVGALLGGMAFVSILICLGCLGWRTSKKKKRKRLEKEGKSENLETSSPIPCAKLKSAANNESSTNESAPMKASETPPTARIGRKEETAKSSVKAVSFKDPSLPALSATFSGVTKAKRPVWKRSASVDATISPPSSSACPSPPPLPASILVQRLPEAPSSSQHTHRRGVSSPSQRLGRAFTTSNSPKASLDAPYNGADDATTDGGHGSTGGSTGHGVVGALQATFRKASGGIVPPLPSSSSSSRWDTCPVFESIVLAPTYRRNASEMESRMRPGEEAATMDEKSIEESEAVRGAAGVLAKFEREEQEQKRRAEMEIELARREEEEAEREERRRKLDVKMLTQRLEEVEAFNSMTGRVRAPLRLVHESPRVSSSVSQSPVTPKTSILDGAQVKEEDNLAPTAPGRPPRSPRRQTGKTRMRESLVRRFRSVPSFSLVERILGDSPSSTAAEKGTDEDSQVPSLRSPEEGLPAEIRGSEDGASDVGREVQGGERETQVPDTLNECCDTVDEDDEAPKPFNGGPLTRTTSSSPMKLHREENIWMGSSSSRRLSRATTSSNSVGGAVTRSLLPPASSEEERNIDAAQKTAPQERQDHQVNTTLKSGGVLGAAEPIYSLGLENDNRKRKESARSLDASTNSPPPTPTPSKPAEV